VNLLARIEANERFVVSIKREGQMLSDGSGLDFSDLDLSGRILSSVTLPNARFDRSILHNARMSSSNYCYASFCDAMLENVSFVNTDASYANFKGANLRNVRAVSFEALEAHFQHANLEGANFYDANLSKANMEFSHLSNTNFRGAFLQRTHFAYAQLTGIALWGAELAGATGLESAQVDWINIGEGSETNQGIEQKIIRLDGEEARSWLLEQAAKPLPDWAK
jgi:uncharacterized protein YjbI with pentapeptide repeats